MNRVKPAIVGIVRIELEADKSARQKLINRHAVKDSRVPGETIEIQIGGRLLGIFIHDIERPVQVVDEDPPFASGLLPEKIDPREQSGTVAGAIDRARHGQGGEVFDLERQSRGVVQPIAVAKRDTSGTTRKIVTSVSHSPETLYR